MTTLTKDQAKAASRLFKSRPPVFDGTRAIVDQHAADRWHADVREAIHRVFRSGSAASAWMQDAAADA